MKENCLKQIDQECIECEEGFVLSFGKCYKLDDNCVESTNKTCEICQNEVMTMKWNCSNEIIEHCEYSINNLTETKCLICEDLYRNDEE